VYYIGERKAKVSIKVDKRNKGSKNISILTEDIHADDGIPVHKHGAEEELIYIEKGRGILTYGENEYPVEAGSMALVPRGTWHGLRNESDDLLRMLFAYTPAGFEDYFRAIGTKAAEKEKQLSAEDWARINDNFEVIYRD
jgi:quercetin dioxygenase-like cupin family protein